MFRGDVHIADIFRPDHDKLPSSTGRNKGNGKSPLTIDGDISLSNRRFLSVNLRFFIKGKEVLDMVGHLSVDDFPVGRLDKTIIIDSGIRAEGGN